MRAKINTPKGRKWVEIESVGLEGEDYWIMFDEYSKGKRIIIESPAFGITSLDRLSYFKPDEELATEIAMLRMK